MSEQRDMKFIIEQYKDLHGDDFTMHDVAEWAMRIGWLTPPTPPTAADLLAKKFARAAREVTKSDEVSGLPYRVWHARDEMREGEQIKLWFDIDDAPREAMWASRTQRRQQVVGDVVQLSLDLAHWNRINPNEEPIDLEPDFTQDVTWRMNAPRDDLTPV